MTVIKYKSYDMSHVLHTKVMLDNMNTILSGCHFNDRVNMLTKIIK